jgi:hypothetical protein
VSDKSNVENGREFSYSADARAQHRNHVHYAAGGLLRPGATLVYNATGEDEPVRPGGDGV